MIGRLSWFLVLFILVFIGNLLDSNFWWSMFMLLAFYAGGFREAVAFHKWWKARKEYEQWCRENDPRLKTQSGEEEGAGGSGVIVYRWEEEEPEDGRKP